MDTLFLKELFIVFALATIVLLLFHKAKIPSLVGFLLTGAIAGPNGLGLVSSNANIDVMAELGVVLLLFTIGVEFSLKTMYKMKYVVLLGGTLQVALTGAVAFAVSKISGASVNQAIFLGFITSLSSTAIAIKVLQERGELESLHGSTALGILIFQDLISIPMLLLIPLLAGTADTVNFSPVSILLKIVFILAFLIIAAKWLVPWLLHEIARTGNRELFLISTFVIIFSIAGFTSYLGLSLALGAFMAGLIISESDYSQQTIGNILPFRDLFTSFFFVSIGMLLNINYLISNPLLVLGVTFAVLFGKTIISGFSVFALGLPLRTQLIVGLALSQVGEFSFILSRLGLEVGLLDKSSYQLFLTVAIITMMLTPFMMSLSGSMYKKAASIPLSKKMIKGLQKTQRKIIDSKHPIENHTVIVGLGINGKNLAQASRYAGIPYVMIDSNADLVKKLKNKGEPIFYGDATSESVQRYARVHKASVMVIAISDAPSTFRITQVARELNPSLHLIVRTRYVKDVEYLYMLGASEVIPEEFETSVEIFTRVLNRYLIPRDEIQNLVDEIRSDAYTVLRKTEESPIRISRHLPDFELIAIRVEHGSEAESIPVSNIKLRRNFGITMVAMRRNDVVITDMNSKETLMDGDVVYLIGSKSQLKTASLFFQHILKKPTVES
jgi:CPA2 family monovalent cation:H+ antiporter-2